MYSISGNRCHLHTLSFVPPNPKIQDTLDLIEQGIKLAIFRYFTNTISSEVKLLFMCLSVYGRYEYCWNLPAQCKQFKQLQQRWILRAWRLIQKARHAMWPMRIVWISNICTTNKMRISLSKTAGKQERPDNLLAILPVGWRKPEIRIKLIILRRSGVIDSCQNHNWKTLFGLDSQSDLEEWDSVLDDMSRSRF